MSVDWAFSNLFYCIITCRNHYTCHKWTGWGGGRLYIYTHTLQLLVCIDNKSLCWHVPLFHMYRRKIGTFQMAQFSHFLCLWPKWCCLTCLYIPCTPLCWCVSWAVENAMLSWSLPLHTVDVSLLKLPLTVSCVSIHSLQTLLWTV